MRWLHLVLVVAFMGPAGCIIIQGPDDDDSAGEDAEGGATIGDGGTGPSACFEGVDCDPLASACGNQERCVPNGGVFQCVATMIDVDEAGPGESCASSLSCQEGLTCVPGTGCVDAPGCCIPLCDLAQPQCPAGTTCMPYFGGSAPLCYEDIGSCL